MPVTQFGVVGDNITDDTAAMQRAFSSGYPLYVPPLHYRIKSRLNAPFNLKIRGDYSFGGASGTFPLFNFRAGVTGIRFPSTAANEILALDMEGLAFHSGETQLSFPNGGVGVNIRRCQFTGPTVAGLHSKGFQQEWFLNQIVFEGGRKGLYMEQAKGSFSGWASLLDKSAFRDIYCTGQTENGIDVGAATSNTCFWESIRLVHCRQDAWVLRGGLRDWVIIQVNNEGNNYNPGHTIEPTAGSIEMGSRDLVVVSVAGLEVGHTLTIAGAGAPVDVARPTDLYSQVERITGSHIILSDMAGATVTNAEVVNFQYCDMKLVSDGNTAPGYITIIGGNFGSAGTNGIVRYGIDASSSNVITGMMQQPSHRPTFYDPHNQVTLVGGGNATVRK